MKKVLCNLIICILAISLFGCTHCTTKLWQDTDPYQTVWIDAEEITAAELKARGVEYRRYSTEKHNGFVVEKSEKEKLKDYTYRALGTPVTLVVDAAATTACGVVVFGYFFITSEGGCEWLNAACN